MLSNSFICSGLQSPRELYLHTTGAVMIVHNVHNLLCPARTKVILNSTVQNKKKIATVLHTNPSFVAVVAVGLSVRLIREILS